MAIESARSDLIMEVPRGGNLGEPLSFPHERLARQKLRTAGKRQEHLQASGRYRGFKDRPITKFKSDFPFRELIDRVVSELPELSDEVKEQRYRSSFRGKILEEVAHPVLSDRLSGSDKAVLTPEDAFEFFRVLHPRNVVATDFFQKSILGIYVPDGLIVDMRNGRVTHILEYTTSLASKADRAQVNNARNVKHSMRNLATAEFTLVHPKQDISPQVEEKLRDVTKIELPFALSSFLELENEMYNQALHELGWVADSSDIKERMVFQDRVYQGFESAERNGLPVSPDWKFYGLEHGLREFPQESVVFWPQD